MKLFTRKNISTNESVYGMTDVGMKRQGNEDAFLLLPEKHLYIVSDGMGGHNAGEVASQTAINAIKTFFARIEISAMPENRVFDIMSDAVIAANKLVWEKSLLIKEYSGMGCTLAMVLFHKNVLHDCHVGDSRVVYI
jgi:PPM family protein phosphatase